MSIFFFGPLLQASRRCCCLNVVPKSSFSTLETTDDQTLSPQGPFSSCPELKHPRNHDNLENSITKRLYAI